MTSSERQLRQRFQTRIAESPELGLALDLGRMNWPDHFFQAMEGRVDCVATTELEKAATANPDEGCVVGGYWLRSPVLVPVTNITKGIPTWNLREAVRANFLLIEPSGIFMSFCVGNDNESDKQGECIDEGGLEHRFGALSTAPYEVSQQRYQKRPRICP